MNVEDFLEGGLAVRQEHVDSLTRQAGPIQRPGHAVRYPEKMGAQALIEDFQGLRVSAGQDKQMALVHRIKVHDGDDALIFVGKACLFTSGDNLAEHTRPIRSHRHAWSITLAR